MILAFDIGNTNVAAGVHPGKSGRTSGGARGGFVSHWTLRRPPRAGRTWWKELTVLVCAEAGIAPADVDGCVVSSVVPAVSALLPGVLRKLTGRTALVVSGALPLGITFAYDDPGRLGPDRVCAMLAAVKKFGAPVIVVDCGTAITFDAVSGRRKHVGGMIAPGMAMSASALGRSTAALPSIASEWSIPLRPAGRNTVEAIRSGVWFGAVGCVRENVDRLKAIVGRSATVVGTGGDAPALMKGAALFDVLDPTLVLEGAVAAWREAGRRKTAATSRRREASR